MTPPKCKKRNRYFKFSYSQIEEQYNISHESLRRYIYRHKVNMKNVDEFVDFICFLRLKNKIQKKTTNSTQADYNK